MLLIIIQKIWYDVAGRHCIADSEKAAEAI
jgi:hypothetical protein